MPDDYKISAESRLCNNETVEVWNIDSDSLADVMLEASAILSVYKDDFNYEPYSNLVTQPVDNGDGVGFNGVLYVHVL